MEEWKDIEDFEGYYQVSNLGRVKSLVRYKRKSEKILKDSSNTTGYTLVQLYGKDRKRKSFLVHRLVMQTFQPNPVMDELEVNHKDLDITNNKISNLEWVTCKENIDHYWRTHTDRLPTPNGELHHLSVLNDEAVLELRRRWDFEKDSYGAKSRLAREFGISEGTARQILSGYTWKHLL